MMKDTKTKWLEKVQKTEPSVYPLLLELIAANPCEVYIDYNDEAGFWQYAVVSAEEAGFWLETFRTITEAEIFITKMGFKKV